MADQGGEGGRKPLAFVGRTRGFLKDVRTEMRKVTTPSMKEVRATTGVVLITVLLFAIYFFGVDSVISFVVDKIFAWTK
jgi:preprotein translocase subunit SecE